MSRQIGGYYWAAPGGIFVLYSVMVGDTKEFWLKSAAADSKIAEIDPDGGVQLVSIEFQYTFDSADYGVGATASFSAEASFSVAPTGTAPPVSIFDDAEIGPTTLSESATLSATFENPNLFEQVTGVTGFIFTNRQVSVTVEATATVSEGAGFDGEGQNRTEASVAVASGSGGSIQNVVASAAAETSGDGEAPLSDSQTDADSGTITPSGNTNTQAWLTVVGGQPWALIKANQITDIDLREAVGRDYVSVLYGPATSLTTYYQESALIPNGADWRGPLVDFNLAPGTSTDACVTENLTDDGVLLAGGNRYWINLDALTGGVGSPTLRQALQTTEGTVPGVLRVQSATTNGSCTLGTAADTPVDVPSPGRGTVEGIVVVP